MTRELEKIKLSFKNLCCVYTSMSSDFLSCIPEIYKISLPRPRLQVYILLDEQLWKKRYPLAWHGLLPIPVILYG